MIYNPTNFVVLLETLNYEDVLGVHDFRDVDTVASITDEEFWSHYDERESEYIRIQQLKQTFITSLKKTVQRKPKNFINFPTPRKNLSESGYETKRKQNKQRSVIRSSTPKPAVKQPISKSVHFNTTNPQIEPRAKKVSKPILSLTPAYGNLLDLIPVDVDALDLELDRLLLNKYDAGYDDEEEDSVSCLSSDDDDSYHTCSDMSVDPAVNHRPEINTTEKPGVELNRIALEPPSMEAISSLPATQIYTCDKPRCGFTTSNASHIKLHTCVRSRNYVE